MALFKNIAKYTKSSEKRLHAMRLALKDLDRKNIIGDVVECGVWRGGNIILTRKFSPTRVCWLYDTFEGMTKPGPHDVKRDGTTAQQMLDRKKIAMSYATLTEVIKNLQETETYDITKIRIIQGDVSKTLLFESNLPEKIALLRLDTDWYESTKIELEKLWPRIVSGGVMIVDDYGHWRGCKKAVDEYFSYYSRVSFAWIDYTAIKMVKP